MSQVLVRYDALVASGELRADPEQRKLAERLDALATALEAPHRTGGLLGRMFGRKAEPVRGVYLWGGVGRGKSMLMDLLFHNVAITAKRRVHFHAFMIEMHGAIRNARSIDPGDPIPHVAADLAANLKLLAFDELQVTNIADAMILSRLFTALIDAGVTVVATSNRVPDDLYKDGLNRDRFLPFIALVKARLDVLTLDGPVDYRLERLGGVDTWHVPNGPQATAALSHAFFKLTDFPPDDAANVPSEDIDVGGGRMLHIPKSLKGVGVFSFKRLCAEARGASDYLAIARHLHTVIIVGIPCLGPENRNEAVRFVTLIDALYEYKVKLLAAADAEPAQLYESGDGRFEFNRTVSRLMEMQSNDYLAKGHGSE